MDHRRLLHVQNEIRQARTLGDEALIDKLNTAICVAHDPDEKVFLLATLASEYHRIGNNNEAEKAILEQTRVLPQRPEVWIQLAEHYLYYTTDLENARNAAEAAISAALSCSEFVRQAYGTRIRIALLAGEIGVIERSLQVLIDYVPPPDSTDTAPETDFLAQIPTDSPIDQELVARYRARSRSS